MEDCSVGVNMVGFADDNTGQNNDFFGEPNREKIDAIVEQAMKNAQYWFDLLGASGGSLEYSKCCIHMMDWCFSKTGSPFLGMYDKIKFELIIGFSPCTGREAGTMYMYPAATPRGTMVSGSTVV
jgi:hypothetical protein